MRRSRFQAFKAILEWTVIGLIYVAIIEIVLLALRPMYACKTKR